MGPRPHHRIAWGRSNTLFVTHPEYFTYPLANANADYQAIAGAAEEIQEQITAGYLMGDVSLWRNRLRLAAGVRFEQTADAGRGLLTDNSRQFRKDVTRFFTNRATLATAG